VRAAELNQLRELPRGPHPPEPSRRNAIASLVAWWSLRHGQALETPHYDATADQSEKTAYEYDRAMEFWAWFGGDATIRDLDGMDVLDAGCGWGGKSIYYAEHSGLRSITGFDLPGAYDPEVPARYARARGLANCTFLAGYAESMPVDAASADVIIMDDVLEHVSDPASVVAEWERVLRPGGVVIVRFPSIRMMFAHHFDRVTRAPALHRVMSMRRWSAGFNHYLASTQTPITPFSRIETRFGREVNCDLSGMDATDFERIVIASSLEPVRLELEPLGGNPTAPARRAIWSLYTVLQRRAPFRELLSVTITFIGRKHG
jgi:ubiquinone/menaquinone biosynthesis C-methylase UbiE